MFRELIRKNKALSISECIDILKSETRGVLSVNGDDGYPYGMPMNHWYDESDGKIYFHCGKSGHRVDALKRDGKVSFCTYNKGSKKDGEWAYTVKSVIVFGYIELIEDAEVVTDIMVKLSHKFTDDERYIQNEIKSAADHTLILKLTPEHICGKTISES